MVTFVVVTGLFKRPQLVPMLSADASVIFPSFFLDRLLLLLRETVISKS